MEKEKLPPQSIEAEENTIGAMLVNSTVAARIVEILRPEMFYDPGLGKIYSSILDLFNNSKPVDIVTVSDDLDKKGLLDEVGGRARISSLAIDVVTTANAEYYAKIVEEKSSLRELINAGSDIVQMAYEESSQAVLELAEQAIFSIAQRHTKSDLVPIKDIVTNTYEQIEQRYSNSEELVGVSSGFYDIDAMTSGFQKSNLIILAARPSVGKTAFALNIAQHVGLNLKKPVLIFDLEMSKEQLVQRMLCSEAEIDARRITTGRLQANDWVSLSEAMGKLFDAPIYIDDSPVLTITDLRAKCRKQAMKLGDIGLIVIDYLQLMQGSSKGGNSDANRVNEISAISRGLKGIAREINAPVIALSQLSREVEKRQDKTPMLSDLRESGSIEQDADIVMFIHRDDYYDKDGENLENKGKAQIIIAKQRNGETGKVDLLFQANITKFKNKAIRPNAL